MCIMVVYMEKNPNKEISFEESIHSWKKLIYWAKTGVIIVDETKEE